MCPAQLSGFPQSQPWEGARLELHPVSEYSTKFIPLLYKSRTPQAHALSHGFPTPAGPWPFQGHKIRPQDGIVPGRAYPIIHLTCVNHSVVSDCYPMDYSLPGSSVHGILQNTGVRSHSLLQRIFPTQGLKPGLLYCRQILFHLSHQGSPFT